jgi:hypothetical protein
MQVSQATNLSLNQSQSAPNKFNEQTNIHSGINQVQMNALLLQAFLSSGGGDNFNWINNQNTANTLTYLLNILNVGNNIQ